MPWRDWVDLEAEVTDYEAPRVIIRGGDLPGMPAGRTPQEEMAMRAAADAVTFAPPPAPEPKPAPPSLNPRDTKLHRFDVVDEQGNYVRSVYQHVYDDSARERQERESLKARQGAVKVRPAMPIRPDGSVVGAQEIVPPLATPAEAAIASELQLRKRGELGAGMSLAEQNWGEAAAAIQMVDPALSPARQVLAVEQMGVDPKRVELLTVLEDAVQRDRLQRAAIAERLITGIPDRPVRQKAQRGQRPDALKPDAARRAAERRLQALGGYGPMPREGTFPALVGELANLAITGPEYESRRLQARADIEARILGDALTGAQKEEILGTKAIGFAPDVIRLATPDALWPSEPVPDEGLAPIYGSRGGVKMPVEIGIADGRGQLVDSVVIDPTQNATIVPWTRTGPQDEEPRISDWARGVNNDTRTQVIAMDVLGEAARRGRFVPAPGISGAPLDALLARARSVPDASGRINWGKPVLMGQLQQGGESRPVYLPTIPPGGEPMMIERHVPNPEGRDADALLKRGLALRIGTHLPYQEDGPEGRRAQLAGLLSDYGVEPGELGLVPEFKSSEPSPVRLARDVQAVIDRPGYEVRDMDRNMPIQAPAPGQQLEVSRGGEILGYLAPQFSDDGTPLNRWTVADRGVVTGAAPLMHERLLAGKDNPLGDYKIASVMDALASGVTPGQAGAKRLPANYEAGLNSIEAAMARVKAARARGR
jgi:hypothetical protein